MEYPAQRLKKEWIQEGITKESVTWTESFGEFLQSKDNRTGPLTSSQIRKFFGSLKQIQAAHDKRSDEIPLLKAKLAYAVGRDKDESNGLNKTKIKEFYEEVVRGIDSIRENNRADLTNFIKIVESVVAYHRFHGGK